MKRSPPVTEQALLARVNDLAAKTINQIANDLNMFVPESLLKAKGWMGELIETALGANAGNTAQPDFVELGIELKTLPIDRFGKPLESTYVTVVPLLDRQQFSWEKSEVYGKLKRVLWVPIISERHMSVGERQVANPFIWSPDHHDMQILKTAWHEIMDMVALGQVEKLNGRFGTYLHVRPKAANSRCLTNAYAEDGSIMQTLPRGFYLRSDFTRKILSDVFR